MSADDNTHRAANLALFRSVLATITAGEFDRLSEFMTDDLIFDLPYGPDFLPNPIEGLEQWNQMQLMMFGMFDSFALELGEVHECLDPDELVAEYRSSAVVKRNGNAYNNRYIGVLRFREGKISQWREFHNPQATDVM